MSNLMMPIATSVKNKKGFRVIHKDDFDPTRMFDAGEDFPNSIKLKHSWTRKTSNASQLKDRYRIGSFVYDGEVYIVGGLRFVFGL